MRNERAVAGSPRALLRAWLAGSAIVAAFGCGRSQLELDSASRGGASGVGVRLPSGNGGAGTGIQPPTGDPPTGDPPARDCVSGGVTYGHGARFKQGCNSCFCQDGRIGCLLYECSDAGPVAPMRDAAVVADASAPPSCEQQADALNLVHESTATLSAARSGDDLCVQTFTPRATTSIRELVLPIYTCRQNYFTDARVELLATLGDGQPDPTQVLARSEIVSNDDLPVACVIDEDAFQPIRFRFEPPVTLQADTLLALNLVGAGDEAVGELFWRRSDPASDAPYADGRAWIYLAHGGGWRTLPGETDFAFAFVLADCVVVE